AKADTSDFNSGGTISVNGYIITIPKNLLFEFPAAFVPFVKVAADPSLHGYEVSVNGNVVNGQIRAGQISIAQLSMRFGNGYIESVGDGSIQIQNGPLIRINDPNGVFSKGYNLKPFFTADDENPSITAFTGFPMCIPRSISDEKCPDSNRPAGQRSFNAPDAAVMAPFKTGDFLEFAGIKLGNEIVCSEIVAANVAIWTPGSSATSPAYLRVEDAIIGLVDKTTTTEFADTRFIGYVSDPSVSVLIHAIQVDPCTGEESEISVGTTAPRPIAADARGKWVFRADPAATTGSKYTREYRISTSTGTKPMKFHPGIIAGQYVQPVTEWIFPELTSPGAVPPPLDFTSFTHLSDGFGPDESGNVFGQLDPWPGASAPTPPKLCSPTTATLPATSSPPPDTTTPADNTTPPPATPPPAEPIANAGADITQLPGVVIVLSATNTNKDVLESDLTYLWTQVSGTPSVTLTGASVAKATFTAPAQAAKSIITREFQVKITSKTSGKSSTDNVVVTTDNTGAVQDDVVIDSYTWDSRQSGTITVTAHTNVVDGSSKLTLKLDAGAALPMTSAPGGKFTYSSSKTKKPASISVTSTYGKTVNRTTTTLRKMRRGLRL
ncbi:hypothetical protein LTR04_003171, partial [Oleoguttula sp. CCFEE 6159]